MMLALDAGNTRLKWGLRAAGTWQGLGALPSADVATLGAKLPQGRYERVIVANVAGPAVESSLARLAQSLGCEAQFMSSRAAQCGVRSSYDDPAQLGPDRWAALIGAWRMHAGASLVVNAGTALTVDALSDEGLFLGGIIAPGIELMRRALDQHTAALRLQPGTVRYFPANTGDAIMSGAVHAAAGAIERMARFMRESGQAELRILLSGGAAALLAPELGADAVVVEHLVLEGLAAIAEEETP